MDDELLAIFDVRGRRIGAKPRGQVHRDGDRHWLVFVWSARREEAAGTRMLLQLRARPGDRFRGQLDAPAGGHVGASESHLEGALRECREEMGVRLRPEDLVYLGRRFLDDPLGECRRVIEHFYLCIRPLLLEDVRFTPEVSGFVEVDLDELAELVEGRRADVPAQARLAAEGGSVRALEITREYLAAYSPGILDSFRRSLRAVRSYLDEGEVDPGVWE